MKNFYSPFPPEIKAKFKPKIQGQYFPKYFSHT